jgi:hypothetical protein
MSAAEEMDNHSFALVRLDGTSQVRSIGQNPAFLCPGGAIDEFAVVRRSPTETPINGSMA